MKPIQILAPLVALFAVTDALEELGIHWTTVFTEAYTTYCPSPTTFVFSDVTYTATDEATVTITNCPCTISVSQPAPKITTKFCTDEVDYTRTGWTAPTTSLSDPWMYPTYGGNPITVVTYTPPATTYISGTTSVTSSHRTAFGSATVSVSGNPPSKTPARASTSRPVTVPTAAAVHAGPGHAGVLLAAGVAVMAL